MSWKTVWLLIIQTIGLGTGLWLRHQGHETAAFWTITGTLLTLCSWLILDAVLGLRMLDWMQKGDLHTPAPRTANLWQDFADATIAQQRKQLRKTQLAQEKLTAFLEAIQALPIGVVLIDELGRIEWFNLIAAEHFGFSSPRDLQQHVIHLLRDPQFVRYWLQSESGQGVVIHGRNHSMQQTVKLSVQFFGFGDGKRLLLSHDITLLEQTDRMRRDFVSNVSHEIRTPLTVLAGFVETLQSIHIPLDTAEAKRYLDLMAQQARRMQTLVNDLLTLSRLEGGPPPDASEHVDIANLLQQCIDDAQSLSRVLNGSADTAHHISLKYEAGTQLQLTGSRNELHSAIGNLLSNAVRYTPNGGNISVDATHTAEGGLRIAVHDTGIGIARDHLSRVAERFYRVDKSRSRETGGTGLGLAIVKHVAQRHGATLEIDSQIGHGSCFSLVFSAQRLSHNTPTNVGATQI